MQKVESNWAEDSHHEEGIDLSSQSSNGAVLLLDENPEGEVVEPKSSYAAPRPLKRRRVSGIDPIWLSSDPLSKHSGTSSDECTPQTGENFTPIRKAAILSAKTTRFLPAQTPVKGNDSCDPSIPSKPPIVLPPRSPSPPPVTPSAFYTPSRHGQRYVRDGLAAFLQNMIISSVENRGGSPASRSQRLLTSSVKIVQTILDNTGSGLAITRAQLRHGTALDHEPGPLNLLLIGGSPRAMPADIVPGSQLEIRKPVWTISLRQQQYFVCVEWQ